MTQSRFQKYKDFVDMISSISVSSILYPIYGTYFDSDVGLHLFRPKPSGCTFSRKAILDPGKSWPRAQLMSLSRTKAPTRSFVDNEDRPEKSISGGYLHQGATHSKSKLNHDYCQHHYITKINQRCKTTPRERELRVLTFPPPGYLHVNYF